MQLVFVYSLFWRKKIGGLIYLDGFQFLAVVGEHVMGGGLGDIQDGFEGDLSFSSEMCLSQGLFTVLGDGFVKLVVLIIAYIISSTNKRTDNSLTDGQ